MSYPLLSYLVGESMKYTLRIKNKRTFKYVIKKGRFFSNKYITVHCTNIKKANNNINFFGICISKKNGNSVQRNKMKRWAREVYKIEELNLKKGFNIIILYKKIANVEILDFKLVHKELIECFKGLDLYEKN